jgi:hypothetical protein
VDRNGNFIQDGIWSIQTIEEMEAHGLGKQSGWKVMVGDKSGI